MATCPQPALLERYAHDELAPDEVEADEVEALERHLAGCRSCMDRFRGLGQEDSMPVVRDCHIVKELGRGHFGVVYKAWWFKEDKPRLVALKWLTFAGSAETQRFEREIQVLNRIDSPHIVKCLDYSTSGGTRYCIMNLVGGTHLDVYLRTSTSSLDEKLAIFQRVCGAVAAAHAEGVIHRDLKPRNILVDSDGQPCVLDFGICALGGEDWSSSARDTITRFGDIFGTLKYMSPEQAWGGVGWPIDERTDIWALGIILYEIVTNGGYPYDLGSTPDEPPHEALLARIRKVMPMLPRLRSIERGRQLEILLERCLAWEAERRLSSAAQLGTDVGRYRAKERIKTRPFSKAQRLRRLAIGAAAKSRWTVLLALIAMLQVTLWVTAFVFDVRWRVTGHAYSSGETGAAPASIDDAREGIVVIGTSDSTVGAVQDFAKANRIVGVTSEIKSWRAVHGHLMQRFASAAPRVVVWDYFFQTPQPGDSRFLDGLRKLEEANVPVILAAQTYNDDGTPYLSRNIATGLGTRMRHGTIVARNMVEREGEFVMAVKRPDGVILPGLALTTLAATFHPEARLDVDWSGRAKHLNLLYETSPGSYLRERHRIELTKAFQQHRPHVGVRPGDLLACKTFELRRPAEWEVRTVPYEELLTCPLDRLRAMVMNKVLVIGDVRPSRFGFQADRHRVRYGGTIINDVPGCYLMADAIAGLMDERYMRSAFPPAPTVFVLTLLFAISGCLLPRAVAARRALGLQRIRQVLWLGLGGLSISCFVLMVLAEDYYLVHLGMGGFSLFTPMYGLLWVEFARNRRPIFEERRPTSKVARLKTDRPSRLRASDQDRPEQNNDENGDGRRNTPHPSDSSTLRLR